MLRKMVKLLQYAQGIGAARKPTTNSAVLKTLKPGQQPSVIFDAGANRGQFLKLALAHPAVIHAFEPSSAAFAELRTRFAATPSVVLNNFALGNEPGTQTLYYDVAGSELSSLYPRHVAHHGHHLTNSESVKVDTIDHYCQTHGIEHIELLKLDVEGHELEVLKGAAQMFASGHVATVSFEFGGCNIDSRTYLRDFFEFFSTHRMRLARVTALGHLQRITHYDESLEQFRTTTFVAVLSPES
jgi:FkbM family methyltransferase